VEVALSHQQGASTTPRSHCAGGRGTIIILVWAQVQRRPPSTRTLTTAAVTIFIFSSPRDASKASIVKSATGEWRRSAASAVLLGGWSIAPGEENMKRPEMYAPSGIRCANGAGRGGGGEAVAYRVGPSPA